MKKKPTKKQQVIVADDKKIKKAYSSLIDILQKQDLTTVEMLISIGATVYSLGASIAGYKGGKGPDLKTLQEQYIIEPKLATALMINGLTMQSWASDVEKTYEKLIDELKETTTKTSKKNNT